MIQSIIVPVLAGKESLFSYYHLKGSIWLLLDDQVCNLATMDNYLPERELMRI